MVRTDSSFRNDSSETCRDRGETFESAKHSDSRRKGEDSTYCQV